MDVLLPAAVSGGTLTHWLVDLHATVVVGQPLALVASDTLEYVIPAPAAGTVTTLLVEAGNMLAAAEPLLQLAQQQAPREPRLTPVARAMLLQGNLDAANLEGSGVDGRIVKRDVLTALGLPLQTPQSQSVPPSSPVAAAPRSAVRETAMLPHAERHPLSRAPAARLAWTIDAGPLHDLCNRLNPSLARYGLSMTPMAGIVYAVAQTLAAQPTLRAVWTDDGLLQRAATDLLITTLAGSVLLAHAADYSPKGVARALATPVAEAVQPTCQILFAADQGALWSDARLLEGYTTALHVGALRKQPLLHHDQLGIGFTHTLTLTYDARVFTEAMAHSMLSQIQTLLEGL